MELNSAALGSMHLSFQEDGEQVRVDEAEIRRLAGPDVKRRLSALKYGFRVAGMATAEASAEGIKQEDILRIAQRFATRCQDYMAAGLNVLGLEPHDEDYSHAKLSLSRIAYDFVSEEWRWQFATQASTPLFQDGQLGRLLNDIVQSMPERYTPEDDDLGIPLARQLAILALVPRLYGLFNHFHFFYQSPEPLVATCLQSTADEAEVIFSRLKKSGETLYGQRALIARIYAMSGDMMVEAYKACATAIVADLQGLSPMERAYKVPLLRSTGGMDLQMVIARHHQAMTLAETLTQAVMGVNKAHDQSWGGDDEQYL